jgi:hypothetical protein
MKKWSASWTLVLMFALGIAVGLAACASRQGKGSSQTPETVAKGSASSTEMAAGGPKRVGITARMPTPRSQLLSTAANDQVQWHNFDKDDVVINFLRGGPRALRVPGRSDSRPVGVNEFPGQGIFPYHVDQVGMQAVRDTIPGPGDPEVSVGG